MAVDESIDSGASRSGTPGPTGTRVIFKLEGPVGEDARREAEDLINRLAMKSPRPVIHARVKLRIDDDRPPNQRAMAQGSMDISGTVIRAQAAASSSREAISGLGQRLERRVRKVAERRETAKRRPPATPADSWRSGDLPTSRPGFYERPPEERRIVRRKSFAPDPEMSVAEALFDLDVLDYRFFLFREDFDHEMAVIYEDDDQVYLQKLIGADPTREDTQLPIRVNPTPAPELTPDQAADRLDVGGQPFVFFRNAETQQGCVVYRRYDGHYGLIEPATT